MKSPLPDENESVAKSRGWFWMGSGVVLMIILIAVGVGFLAKKQELSIKNYGGMPAPTATPIVEEKKEFTVEIWNGSGVAGAAAKEELRIKKLGIKVVGIDTAEEKVTENQLWVRKGFEQEAKKWLGKLKVDEITGTLVEGTAAARLVLGR